MLAFMGAGGVLTVAPFFNFFASFALLDFPG
jgi:hypothetical protein